MRVREIRANNGSFFVDDCVTICACCGSRKVSNIADFNRHNIGYTIFAGATLEDINGVISSEDYTVVTIPLENNTSLLIKCNNVEDNPEEDEDD